MSLSISLEPYAPTWPGLFEREAESIAALLGENCVTIHHVGSTAVTGMKAKPIIDMIPVVHDIAIFDPVPFIARGYKFSGELGMPFRRYLSFQGDSTAFHLHVWQDGHPEIEKNLLFCDYLRRHPEAVQDYETVKESLAHYLPDNRAAYTRGKNEIIQSFVEKSGFTGLLLSNPFHEQEWIFYESLFEKRPTPLGIKPFVFYQGATLIGGAQLDASGIMALRFVTITGEKQAPYFRNQLEKWHAMPPLQHCHSFS